MLDYQLLFNILVTAATGMGGWIIGRITKSLDQLDRDVRDLPDKYVSKADYNETMHRIENLLARIDEKIDRKVDR